MTQQTELYTTIGTETFEVRQTKNKFFYYSRRAGRWLPVKQALVQSRPVQMKTVINRMSGQAVEIPANTPWCCNPASETYWSM